MSDDGTLDGNEEPKNPVEDVLSEEVEPQDGVLAKNEAESAQPIRIDMVNSFETNESIDNQDQVSLERTGSEKHSPEDERSITSGESSRDAEPRASLEGSSVSQREGLDRANEDTDTIGEDSETGMTEELKEKIMQIMKDVGLPVDDEGNLVEDLGEPPLDADTKSTEDAGQSKNPSSSARKSEVANLGDKEKSSRATSSHSGEVERAPSDRPSCEYDLNIPEEVVETEELDLQKESDMLYNQSDRSGKTSSKKEEKDERHESLEQKELSSIATGDPDITQKPDSSKSSHQGEDDRDSLSQAGSSTMKSSHRHFTQSTPKLKSESRMSGSVDKSYDDGDSITISGPTSRVGSSVAEPDELSIAQGYISQRDGQGSVMPYDVTNEESRKRLGPKPDSSSKSSVNKIGSSQYKQDKSLK